MKTPYVLAAISLLTVATNSFAVQYPNLLPGYTQEIYTGPLTGGPGMAWTSSNNLLTRNGSDILEYSPTQNAVHQLTNIHGVIATHTIAGLSNTGYGMTNGLDGYIYTVTGAGLERFNPNNWAAPAQLLPGTVGGQGYGVTTLPDGRIAYSDGSNSSSVWIYDPVAATNTLIYQTATSPNGPYLIDGMISGPTGHLALAGQSNSTINIISNTGTTVNWFFTSHFPDGLAFAENATQATIYTNNNDGTITRYDLAPGYLGTPTVTDIAFVSGAYGDLAAVGPDCAFYVSQFNNFGLHGSVNGVGTNWDSGVTNAEPSIIRIGGGIGADGLPVDCQFYSPIMTHDVAAPEPTTLALLAAGFLPLLRRSRSSR